MYNRAAAVEYARKWALSYNPAYYHFGGIGGDCTNFISQCLFAGGQKMNYAANGWFYINAERRSPSWAGVNELNAFLLSDHTVGPKAELSSLRMLEVGDIIQLRQNPTRFNHSLIISRITQSEIYVCAHSNDALDRPLSTYQYFELLHQS